MYDNSGYINAKNTYAKLGVYTDLDTLTGDIKPYPYKHINDKTTISYTLYQHDSILFKLTPSTVEYISEEISSLHFRAEGRHNLDVKLYLPRTNTCGPVHLTDEKAFNISPRAYRHTGDYWSYEYQLKREGLTSSPWVHEITKNQM